MQIPRRAMRPLSVITFATFAVSCAQAESVPSNEALRALVGGIVPKTYSTEAARITLEEKHFTCYSPDSSSSKIMCRRKVSNGIVCDQVQFAYLPLASSAVGEIETKLDSICL